MFLTHALGAGRIQKAADLNGAKTFLDGGNGEYACYKWLFVDDHQVGAAETMLGRHKVRIVGNEFICQSLILGGLAED